MSADTSNLLEPLRQIANQLASPPRLPENAHSVAQEILIIRYGVGEGTFTGDLRHLRLRGKIHRLNGKQDGEWESVYELLQKPAEIQPAPNSSGPPFNRPGPPVNHVQPRAYSKGRWTFRGGSSLTAVGPAMLHKAETSVRSNIIWLSANQAITNGTGKFANARGLKTGGIALYLPPGTALSDLGKPGKQKVAAKTLDVFRVLPPEIIDPRPLPELLAALLGQQ